MSPRAKEITNRIESFRDRVIAFVENLSDEDWKKTCEWEAWPVGVTARHIGAAHFAIPGMLEMIINGEDLPQMTMEEVNEKAKANARKHLDCTKAETLDLLRHNGAKLVAFVAGLSDGDLARMTRVTAMGGDVNTEQVIENVIFYSARRHFDSMKAAIGK